MAACYVTPFNACDKWRRKVVPMVENGLPLEHIVGRMTRYFLTPYFRGGPEGRTLLHEAARCGRLDIMNMCFQYKSDLDLADYVNAKDHSGYTALMTAICHRHLEAVGFLLEHGADCYTRDRDGYDLMWTAVKCGRTDILQYIVDRKTSFSTASDITYSTQHIDLFAQLIKDDTTVELATIKSLLTLGVAVENKQKFMNLALIAAVANNLLLEVVTYLVESGADINRTNINGYTALGVALNNQNGDICAYLCSLPDKRAGLGQFVITCETLMWAARIGELPIVKHLVEMDAKVNCRTNNGKTALGIALQERKVEIVKYLISLSDKKPDHGNFDLESKDQFGQTVITWAAMKGEMTIARYITEEGADVNSIDNKGNTALSLAVEAGETEISSYLYSRPDIESSMIYAAEWGKLHVVKHAVEQGLNVNHMNEKGKTALSRSTDNGHIDIMKYLCRIPGITVRSFDEFDRLTLALYGVDGAYQDNTENSQDFDDEVNDILLRFITLSTDFIDDADQLCVFYRGNLYKMIIRLYVEKQHAPPVRYILLSLIYKAIQATLKCEQSKKKTLKDGLGDELYEKFCLNIEYDLCRHDEEKTDEQQIAQQIFHQYIKQDTGRITTFKSSLKSCWDNSICANRIKKIMTFLGARTKSCFSWCFCRRSNKGAGGHPLGLHHGCKARGSFALLTCTLAVIFYCLDLYSDIIVGYDDLNGFSQKLGIFELVLVGFTLAHENVRSSISQYDTEEDVLKMVLGKQLVESADWSFSDLHYSDNRFKKLMFALFWPFAIRKTSSLVKNVKAVIFNLLTILQLRPVVDRLRVLLHTPTSIRAFYRHQTEQNSLKQFYLITEQLPELMIQFYTFIIVFNIGNRLLDDHQATSINCESNFHYDKFTDGLNNNTNSFCERLSLSPSGKVTCGIAFRVFSMMIPFFMIPSGIVSLEDGFRVLDPVTPMIPTTVKCFLQAMYTLMIPARVFMFAALMHSMPKKEIVFGYIIFRVIVELFVNLYYAKGLRRYFTAPKDIKKSKIEIASGNRAEFTKLWQKIGLYLRYGLLHYGGAFWRISMFSVRDVFAISLRSPDAYMSNSSNVSYNSLRKLPSLARRAIPYIFEGLFGALFIEKYFPCGKESGIFKYTGWICLVFLIFSVTLLALIADLLHPKTLESACIIFPLKSLMVSGTGLIMGGVAAIIFYGSQSRTSLELWTLLEIVTFYLLFFGAVILVIKLFAIGSVRQENKTYPKDGSLSYIYSKTISKICSERKSANCYLPICHAPSQKDKSLEKEAEATSSFMVTKRESLPKTTESVNLELKDIVINCPLDKSEIAVTATSFDIEKTYMGKRDSGKCKQSTQNDGTDVLRKTSSENASKTDGKSADDDVGVTNLCSISENTLRVSLELDSHDIELDDQNKLEGSGPEVSQIHVTSVTDISSEWDSSDCKHVASDHQC